MRKKTLAILTLISLGLFLVGIAVIAITPATPCLPYSPDPYCPPPNTPEGMNLVGLLVIVAAGIFQTIAWIGAINKQVQRQQWIWLVCTFLFSPICLWIYLLAVPEAVEPIHIPPEHPIYRPYMQGDDAPQPTNAQTEVYQESRQQYQ